MTGPENIRQEGQGGVMAPEVRQEGRGDSEGLERHSAPRRIQRQRSKGWRMPEGAVYVGRPARWGNPFEWHDRRSGLVQEPGIGGDRTWDYEGRASGDGLRHDFWFADGRVVRCDVRWATRTELVELYRLTLTSPTASMRMAWPPHGRFARVTVEDIKAELAGKDLACWCPLDQPCHADVLLELANQPAAYAAMDAEDVA